MSRSESYTRGRLAKATGCNAETIRFYEREGLLPPPPRTAGGHRIYGEDALRRLAFVLRCRELGFDLADIRELIGLIEHGSLTCGEVRAIASRHLGSVRSKLDRLRRMESVLASVVSRCRGGRVPDCPVIDVLTEDLGRPGSLDSRPRLG